jgi:hypothetical protein
MAPRTEQSPGNMTPEQTLAELLEDGSYYSATEANATLRAIWAQLHAPQRRHSAAELVTLFRRAGYVSDGILSPSSAVTIYRGELLRSAEAGISWTADPQIARKYAQGYATVGATRFVRAIAPPEAVLARFNQEEEVVVDPDLLRNVEELGRLPYFVLPKLAPF